ncbi:type II toxin-antitoxin system PemK/MazF family toxin [Salmonella enterica]
MTMDVYTPERGDLIWLDLDPTVGTEITKRRPVLVLSPQIFNKVTGFAMVAPVTSTVRGFSMEVALMDCETKGVVLCHQTRSVAWPFRDPQFIEEVPIEVVNAALSRVNAIFK